MTQKKILMINSMAANFAGQSGQTQFNNSRFILVLINIAN